MLVKYQEDKQARIANSLWLGVRNWGGICVEKKTHPSLFSGGRIDLQRVTNVFCVGVGVGELISLAILTSSSFIPRTAMERGDGGSSTLFVTAFACDVCGRNFPTVGEAENHERGCGCLDMRPFFEFELKVLPIAVTYFERARSIEINGGVVMTRQNSLRHRISVDKHKLSAIYQFIRAMPEVFE